MRKFKIATVVYMLSFTLLAVQPNMIRPNRVDISSAPPAISLVQRKDNNMLLDHDFKDDNVFYVNVKDASEDTGFYVSIK